MALTDVPTPTGSLLEVIRLPLRLSCMGCSFLKLRYSVQYLRYLGKVPYLLSHHPLPNALHRDAFALAAGLGLRLPSSLSLTTRVKTS